MIMLYFYLYYTYYCITTHKFENACDFLTKSWVFRWEKKYREVLKNAF